MRTWLLLATALQASTPILRVNVSPHVVDEGGTVQVVCIVPSNPFNEWVTLGIEEYAASGQQLHPSDEDAQINVFLQEFKSIPCDAGRAYCTLVRADRDETVFSPLKVAGCEGLSR